MIAKEDNLMEMYTVILNDGQEFFMSINWQEAKPVQVKFHTTDRRWYPVGCKVHSGNDLEHIANQVSKFYYEGETEDYTVSELIPIVPSSWL